MAVKLIVLSQLGDDLLTEYFLARSPHQSSHLVSHVSNHSHKNWVWPPKIGFSP